MPTELLTWGREVLAQQPFSVMLGAQLDTFEPGSAQLSVPMSQGLLQQDGFVHGGVLAYLADNALRLWPPCWAAAKHRRCAAATSFWSEPASASCAPQHRGRFERRSDDSQRR